MVFSSEKKELWRYASRNNVNCSVGVGNNRPQQLHRHQHLHRLQSPPPDYYATTTTTARKLIQQQEPQLQLPPAAAGGAGAGATTTTTTRNITTVNTTCLTDDNRLNQQQQQLEEHNMPPPPYSSVPCGIDCSDTCQQRRRRLSTTSSNCGNYDGGLEEMDGGGSGSISGSGSVDRYSIGGISYIDGKSAFTCASVSSSRSISSLGKNKNNSNNNNMERNEHDWKLYNNNYDNEENAIVVATTTTTTSRISTTTTTTSTTSSASTTIPIVTSTASVLAATAASIFRNCCGGSIGGGDGVLENANQSSNSLTITSTTSNNSKNNNNKHSILLAKNCNTTTTTTTTACFTRRQYFDAFIKHLKEGQVTALLKAVKSRLDPISSLTALYQQRKQQQQHQQNQHQHQQYAPYCCILVHRALIMNEELHVIACRLFFWPELKDASELKCLPDCPNHCDPMYICCNPLHWCRIFKAETAPPPYQLNSNTCDKMQYNDTTILENGRSQNIENNVPPTRQNYLLSNENIVQNLCVQIPESVATAGEGKKITHTSIILNNNNNQE